MLGQFNGVWLLLFLGRWSMVQAWMQLARNAADRYRRKDEPVEEQEQYPEAVDYSDGSSRYLTRHSSTASCPMSPLSGESGQLKGAGPVPF